MAKNKPNIPKGTRDFLPAEMVSRNYIFDTIKQVFLKYGYQQVETPAMENLSNLMGKYGEEGDKLLFKILNSGDYLSDLTEEECTTRNSQELSSKICEKGLRYDLTVPFARFVVQHQNELVFPFKRYQVQPVWRADRPQKGRYREFYQCDVDVIGSDSLLNEVELIQIIDEVFHSLEINCTIKLNNRKILAGLAEIIGEAENVTDITVAIDKLEKIGIDNVNAELSAKGITDNAIQQLQPVIHLGGSNNEKINELKNILSSSETGSKGVEEIEKIFGLLSNIDINTELELDLTLARGLNYYTGAIIEVKAQDIAIGSICGGGRYDNLTGIFGLDGISGVGISFGADRIYDVLNQLNLFPEKTATSTKILFVNFGTNEAKQCFQYVTILRKAGISAELYPDSIKLKKQFGYANKRNVEYVATVGENELQEGNINLKNMETGKQQCVTIEELIEVLKDG